MSEAVYMSVIGGYLALMGTFTKVAYSDPSFYLDFLEKILSKISVYLSFIIGSFWIGLYVSRAYAERNLNLSPEQSKIYLSDYSSFTFPLSLLYFACCAAYVYSFFLLFLAENKKRSTHR
ncbi:hypothetical protein [Pantoea agglomerans]|uniref:hypothetical protein n=1 Tax=Enterobacter agglomerans TaxID=549 RepID=UPI003159F4DF